MRVVVWRQQGASDPSAFQEDYAEAAPGSCSSDNGAAPEAGGAPGGGGELDGLLSTPVADDEPLVVEFPKVPPCSAVEVDDR
jgi:hypothetical protein